MTDTRSGGPLAGITVLDLTRVLAGPYCTKTLYDLGARVIKVEPPGGDAAREVGPFVEGMSAYFLSLNYGKESICLDLKTPSHARLFGRLVDRCDILVENFRPGVMEKLGFGWPRLKRLNEKLIYAAISGFGATGPYAGRPAYDMVVQGMGGIMSITGEEGGTPVRVGTSIGDIAAGLFAANAIQGCLFDRTRTGQGAFIDLSMLDCQVALTENAQARYHATGEVPRPLGSRHPSTAPFDAFDTSDGQMIVAVGSDVTFKRLCVALGREDLITRADYAGHAIRSDNQASLKATLAPLFNAKTTAEWIEILLDAGVPCGPINSIADVAADPQVGARNMIVGFEGNQALDMKISGSPVKISGVPDPRTRQWAPRLDEQGAAIRAEFAGQGDS